MKLTSSVEKRGGTSNSVEEKEDNVVWRSNVCSLEGGGGIAHDVVVDGTRQVVAVGVMLIRYILIF